MAHIRRQFISDDEHEQMFHEIKENIAEQRGEAPRDSEVYRYCVRKEYADRFRDDDQ